MIKQWVTGGKSFLTVNLDFYAKFYEIEISFTLQYKRGKYFFLLYLSRVCGFINPSWSEQPERKLKKALILKHWRILNIGGEFIILKLTMNWLNGGNETHS